MYRRPSGCLLQLLDRTTGQNLWVEKQEGEEAAAVHTTGHKPSEVRATKFTKGTRSANGGTYTNIISSIQKRAEEIEKKVRVIF